LINGCVKLRKAAESRYREESLIIGPETIRPPLIHVWKYVIVKHGIMAGIHPASEGDVITFLGEWSTFPPRSLMLFVPRAAEKN
jgi:hypothetical protein